MKFNKNSHVATSYFSEEVDKDSGKSLEESIKEDIDESKVDRTINSRSKIVESENGKHSTPLKEGENLKSGFEGEIKTININLPFLNFRVTDGM